MMVRKVAWHRLALATLLLLALLGGLTSCRVQRRSEEEPQRTVETVDRLLASYDQARLRSRVERLTDEGLAGRAAGSDGGEQASAYLADELQAAGLAPWQAIGLQEMVQVFMLGKGSFGRNVIGVYPGELTERFLLITAHYDHLGVRDGQFYPGADDNAVGVAAALEIAACLQESGLTPRRTVVVALLDGEEAGLIGSRVLATRVRRYGLVEATRVLNLDMLGGVGGEMVSIWRERPYEQSEALATIAMQELEQAGIAAERISRRFGPVDSRSFARRGMASITLSWDLKKGNHPYRHTADDSLANLQPELVDRATQAAIRVAWALANR